MALTDCPSCNKKISDKSEECPHCQFRVGDLRAVVSLLGFAKPVWKENTMKLQECHHVTLTRHQN